MLLKVFVYFSLLTPLLGIIQVEKGAFAWSVNETGYENGASLAFISYVLISLFSLFIITRGRFFSIRENIIIQNKSYCNLRKLYIIVLILNIILSLIFIFVFGGYQTIIGSVAKGEFRASLGGFGAIAYLISKWLSPALFAFLCALRLNAPNSGKMSNSLNQLLFANAFFVFLIGVAWGFKTTAILMLMPGVIILKWNHGAGIIGKLIIGSFLIVYALFLLFDTTDNSGYTTVLEFLWARVTVLQGDVAWYLWGRHVDNDLRFNYFWTLSVAIGDSIWSLLTGITRENPEIWVLSHYGSLLTYAAGYPIEGILEGHNVTGTPFSEGLIAGGEGGAYFFGLLSGCIIGLVYNKMTSCLRKGHAINAAVWSCYFVFCVFSWLNGGEIVQLFHISVFVSMLAAWLAMKIIISVVNLEKTCNENIEFK